MAQVGCRACVDHRAPAAHMALPMVENRVTNEILEYGVARRRPCVVSEVLFGGPSGLIGTRVSTIGRMGTTVTNSPIVGLLHGEMVDPLNGEVVAARSTAIVVAIRKGPLMVAVRTEPVVVALRTGPVVMAVHSDEFVVEARTGLVVGILVAPEHRLGRVAVARGRLVIDARRLDDYFAA
jgi:hypothetical protein